MQRGAGAFAQVRFAFWIQRAQLSALFHSMTRIECDAVIRVYDEASNVIETREPGEFREPLVFNRHHVALSR